MNVVLELEEDTRHRQLLQVAGQELRKEEAGMVH